MGRVFLDANHAPTRAVLRLLMRRNNRDYVFGSGVRGQVTASLHGVPFDTALDALLKANQPPLTRRVINGVYLIRGAQTRPGGRRRHIRVKAPVPHR